MYKNNIVNMKIKYLYQLINELNEVHPLWWQHFIENIIGNTKVTFINQTTIIIALYELNIQDVYILYNILKKFKVFNLLDKVINKKEFLIIHIDNTQIMHYLTDSSKWLGLVAYKYLSDYYDLNYLELIEDEEEIVRFTYQGTIYHILTNPLNEYKSNKYHKYIYLYKDLYIQHLKKTDNRIKYLRCKEEFYKNFKLIIEKTR